MVVEAFEDYLKVLVGFRMLLSSGHKGAIVSLGGGRRARAVAATGVPWDHALSPETVADVFRPGSDTYDLGVVILGGEILGARCQFPLPAFDKKWDDSTKKLGSRHRAAMGMSRYAGSEVLVLSEETGEIRLARGGRLVGIDAALFSLTV